MENFLVVILFVGSIVYKIYTNYKKEMEKSAKRIPNQQARPIPPIPREIKIEPYKQNYKTEEVKQYNQTQTDYIPEEVARLKQQKMVKQKEERKSNKLRIEKDTRKEENELAYNFDLREAIIQSTILERPYK